MDDRSSRAGFKVKGVSFQRIKHTVLAFASVAISYVAYALIAVPLIEPSVTFVSSLPTRLSPPVSPQYTELFSPGSWELDRPKILETEQGTLLFDDYQPLDDHRKLRLKRCTFIRYVASKGLAGTRQPAGRSSGRPIVMRAGSGAVLDFDSTLDVGRGQFGRLVGGQLAGEVLVTSPASAAGMNDALQFKTRDVQIDERRIWTPHEVEFVYGPHRGRGRDLRIEWAQSAPPAGSDGGKPPLGGIRSLELVHLESLELQVPAGDLPGDISPAHRGASQPLAATRSTKTASLAVSCRGPIRVDFPRYCTSLSEEVRVIRHGEEGLADQLVAELLEIYFAPAESPAVSPRAGRASDPPPLRLERLIAQGNPAKLIAPSRNAEAIAARMEYDLVAGTLRMEDKQQLRLSDPDHRIETTELEYEVGKDGRVGRFWAAGPGRLWARSAAGGRELEATWQQEVRLRRHEDSPVLSLWKGQITLARTERFAADELHAYLKECPKAGSPDKFDLVPDRMKAMGRVTLESSRLTGSVREASLWFVPTDPSAPRDPENGPSMVPSDLNAPAAANAAKYDLQAEVLQAQIGLTQPPRIERLTLQNHVRFQQVSGEVKQAVLVEGDLFELQDAHAAQARAVLFGSPARVALGETNLAGNEIHLSQAESSVDIVGAGSMSIPPPAATTPLPPMQVQWRGGMRFHGDTALFTREVEVRGSRPMDNGDVVLLLGKSASLRVTLNRTIDFAHPESSRKAEVENLAFDSDVFLQNECLDASRQRKAFQQTEARTLALNQLTGELQAAGPGWISSVHRREPAAGPSAIPASQSGIEYLRVDYLRELTGKLSAGQIEFHERVRAVYGPVVGWEQTLDAAQAPGPDDSFVVLTSDRLSVADMSNRPGNFQDVELEATGNALVRGGTFSASAQRIAYVRSKDQVIAEGDGRNDAVLRYQPSRMSTQPGELKAGKILYCPSTRLFELNNFQRLDVQDLQKLNRDRSNP